MRAALVAIAICLWATPVAGAAEVSVEESSGYTMGGLMRLSKLELRATSGERNDVTIREASRSGELMSIELIDRGAAVTAGSGCTGGGSVGVPILCAMHLPTAPPDKHGPPGG